jgi:hypothetical protein
LKPLRNAIQSPQPFAGEQHQIIERQAHQPVSYWCGIRSVSYRHQRAAQGFGALLLEHAREPVELAGFRKGYAAAGKRADCRLIAHRRRS